MSQRRLQAKQERDLKSKPKPKPKPKAELEPKSGQRAESESKDGCSEIHLKFKNLVFLSESESADKMAAVADMLLLLF